MRTSNAIDFWRGVALVMIFVDHVPGNVYSTFTLQSMAICDAAELFVFLAGWSLSYATGGPITSDRSLRVIFRLVSRSIELYRAQLVISALALAGIAGMALWRSNPLFIEWNNAGLVFFDPVRGLIGVVLLSHQLNFVDILPLYIALLLLAVPLILLARANLIIALLCSLTIYLAVLSTSTNLPTWPGEGGWFFNPLAWQLVLMLGFAAGELSQSGHRLKATAEIWCPAAAVASFLFVVASQLELSPDPLLMPEPRLLFLFDKTFVSPVRIANLLALVLAFAFVYPWLMTTPVKKVDSLLCGMGRNSLAVFSIGSLLSLAGQFTRFVYGGSILTDTAIVLAGVLGMVLTCWFVEWRERTSHLRRLPQSRSSD